MATPPTGDLLVLPRIIGVPAPPLRDGGPQGLVSNEDTLVEGRDLISDEAAAEVATCARARGWPVLAAWPARLRVIDPELTVEILPGMPCLDS
jgi:hypothetical protein